MFPSALQDNSKIFDDIQTLKPTIIFGVPGMFIRHGYSVFLIMLKQYVYWPNAFTGYTASVKSLYHPGGGQGACCSNWPTRENKKHTRKVSPCSQCLLMCSANLFIFDHLERDTPFWNRILFRKFAARLGMSLVLCFSIRTISDFLYQFFL